MIDYSNLDPVKFIDEMSRDPYTNEYEGIPILTGRLSVFLRGNKMLSATQYGDLLRAFVDKVQDGIL